MLETFSVFRTSAPFSDDDIVYRKGSTGGTAKLRDRVVKLCLGKQLTAPGRGEVLLPLEDKEKSCSPRSELPLLARIQLLGSFTANGGGVNTCLGGTKASRAFLTSDSMVSSVC